MPTFDLSSLPSPILIAGDATTAYRDPCAVYDNGVLHLFYTLVTVETDGAVYLYLAKSTSTDLLKWSPPRILTRRNQAENFSSPGSIVRYNGEWVLSLQTYPRQNGEKYANDTARVWIMRSGDLETWSEPELLRVKGPDVPDTEMGRMIDPYILVDKDDPGLYWCLYKQNGASLSSSRDLTIWTYNGHFESGENVCVLNEPDGYVLFHSPENGVGIKRSTDLRSWTDAGTLTLGQADWPWAQGRLTAGFVLDLCDVAGVEAYVMFFHGSGPEDESVIFDTHACIGIAWSYDLAEWTWPGKA
ncbi:MAG TPA: hypothetical protein VGK19_21655 [Capsulimonadaceae bacterium]|jgi:hypothetical protein